MARKLGDSPGSVTLVENGPRLAPRSFESDHRIGSLAGLVSGPPADGDRLAVVMVHGITANVMTWLPTMRRLDPSVTAVAVDLRGRGDSAGLGPPYGIRNHADDVARTADRLGVDRVIVVGHSMGAYVATTFAERYPDRFVAGVLVDGGLAITTPVQDVDAALEAVLGPALARLRQTFRSRDDYRQFWRTHPALASSDLWNDDIERYVSHDLSGVAPSLRSRVAEEAVRVDGAEVLFDHDVIGAVGRIDAPLELLRVERGLLDEPIPLIPIEVATAAAVDNPRLRITTVPGMNHYTIALAPAGADAISAAVGRAVSSWR